MNRLAGMCVLAGMACALCPADPSDDFYSAIRANDLTKLRGILAGGASASLKDGRGLTPLMYAAAVGSVDAMKILIDKGADVNARNAFDSTALMWSATDINKVRLLVDHGADVNAASKQGRTALIIAAMSEGSTPILRLLISRGANVKAVDNLKMTGLVATTGGITGSGAGDAAALKLFIDAGLDVNAANAAGYTALLNASGAGNVEAVKLLLAKGAKVNVVSSDKSMDVKNGAILLGRFTPLLVASALSPPELVKLLLDAGADVNARDVRGMTPLMLAIATDYQNPEIIRMLLAKGADVNMKSNLGETAADWARKIGAPAGLQALNVARPPERVAAVKIDAVTPVELKPAVERSISLLEKSTAKFFPEGGCISCHAQNMTDVAVSAARSHGARVDEKAAQDRKDMVKAFLGAAGPMLLERMDAPGASDTVSYLLNGLASAGYAPDRITDALLANTVAQQSSNGRWHLGAIARSPFEDGDIFRTAVGIRAMKVFGPPGRGAEMAERITRARQWLERAKPLTAEDRNMQVLGLGWAGSDAKALGKFVPAILSAQRADGGWAQREGLGSDAYATGESLFALATAGVKASEAVYQKGVKYLLSTQAADGSWHVASRSPKFQPYFESGFPYGHDQWISSAATAWAVAGLSSAIESPVRTAALR